MRYLLAVFAFCVGSFVNAATIVAPTEMVDGQPLPLADLSHYRLECNGVEEQMDITGAEQEFTKPPNTTCRAKAVTKANEVSAWSNEYTFPNAPAVPIIRN